MRKDFHLIALTFLLYKCMERIKKYQHKFKGSVDLLQFAYLSNQSSVDASLILIHKAHYHIDYRDTTWMCTITPDFSVYINELQCNRENLTLLKYADGLSLISCQTDANSSTYFECIRNLVQWFDNSNLLLYIEKNKELCCRNQKSLCLI